MKILLAIITCQKDIRNGLANAIEQTWGKGKEIDFFYAKGRMDEYDHLPFKVRNACEYGYQYEHDWLMKLDVDTYVRPEKIEPFLPFFGDYTGFILTGETYCSGGAGYLLSRKAMEIVAHGEVNDTLEDRWVGKVLSREGIVPVHSRSFMPWRVPITRSNDVISVHLSQPGHVYDKQWMYDIHREWEAS